MRVHVSDWIREFYPEYYGWFEYPADRTVAFGDTHAEWGILGNMASTPLTVDGVPFSSAEAVFQVMKFTDPAVRKAVFAKKGQGVKMRAKHYEKEVGVRPDWGSILVDALKFCVLTKYEQSEAFRAELARTGDRFIVEKNVHPRPDTYNARLSEDRTVWSGPNLMGRLLMELRDTGTLEYRLPEEAMRFSDLLEE